MAACSLLLVACADPATRPGDSNAPEVLFSYTQSEWVHWIQSLAPPSTTRGNALDLFNDIKDAADKQGAADVLFAFMLDGYDLGELTLPSQPKAGADATLLEELLFFLAAVAEHYGISYDIPDPGNIDLDLEHVIDVVTSSDFPNATSEICIPTNIGNAAMCLKLNSLNLPAFISILERTESEEGYVFPMPPGFIKTGKVFDFEDYSSINGDGAGVVAVLCVPPGHVHNGKYHLFRDPGDGNDAEQKPVNAAAPYSCPEPQASIMKGDGLFARGVNAAGNLVLTALSPKRAYADHSLAHRGFAFSEWQIGQEEEPEIGAAIVRVIPPATHTATSAVFKKQGSYVLWVKLTIDGNMVGCSDLPLSSVTAQATATASATGPITPVSSAQRNANRCENVDGIPAWVFELPNPRNNQVSHGTIQVKVNGEAATPTFTYSATL